MTDTAVRSTEADLRIEETAVRRPGEPALPRADAIVDATGLLCPMPIVKLAQAIQNVEVGRIVEVTATDPGILADAPAWASLARHELIGQHSSGARHSFWFRKLHD